MPGRDQSELSQLVTETPLIPNLDIVSFHRPPVNCAPRSVMTSSGMPYLEVQNLEKALQ